jgi:hypothetical protein
MTSLEKSTKLFFHERGFASRRGFWKYLADRSLLVEASFKPVKPAFAGADVLGYAIVIHVYYPTPEHFILISPAELSNLRRDGTLRHVVYASEHDGMFRKTDGEAVGVLLEQWFDFWYQKLTVPQHALEIVDAIRGRAPLPPCLSYLAPYIAHDDADKLRLEAQQQAFVFPFDGGVNFESCVAYLNAAGRFADALGLIDQARDVNFFEGRPHGSVALRGALKKMANDAAQQEIALSEANRREIAKWLQPPATSP